MANKREISFSQGGSGGKHFITNTVDGRVVGAVEIDTNKLDIADISKVINGLANLMSSLSSVMYKFEKETS